MKTYFTVGKLRGQFYLTTYKIATLTLRESILELEPSNKQFFCYYSYSPDKGVSIVNGGHNINSKKYIFNKIVKEPLICLVRNPENRMVTGFLQDFCDIGAPFHSPAQEKFYNAFTSNTKRIGEAKISTASKVGFHYLRNYYFDHENKGNSSPYFRQYINTTVIKDFFVSLFHNDHMFRAILIDWTSVAMNLVQELYTYEELTQLGHLTRYHENLYNLIDCKFISSPEIKEIRDINWHASYIHSNKPIGDIIKPILMQSPYFNTLVKSETEYYKKLKNL